MHLSRLLTVALALGATSLPLQAQLTGSSLRREVRKYLDRYQDEAARLHADLEEARWRALVAPDADALAGLHTAETTWAAFVGRPENIELSRTYLRRDKELAPVDLRCLTRIAFEAQGAPALVGDLVGKRLSTLADARRTLRTRTWRVGGEDTTAADVVRILREERDLRIRRAAWESAHAPGTELKPALVRLRWLQNEIVRSLGVSDWFTWRAREYGMSVGELQRALEAILSDLRPLQVELHTFLRYELARLHEQPVPGLLPAHWLPLEGEEEALVTWLGLGPADEHEAAVLEDSPETLIRHADQIWESLGFTPLPPAFYERSALGGTPVPGGPPFRVVDVDRAGDVRALFGGQGSRRGLFDALSAVGEVQCTLQMLQPNVPFLLRRPANRSFHAALARAVALGAGQSRTLRSAGLSVPVGDDASAGALLTDALRFLLPLYRSGGTLFDFERALYRDELDPARWNERWWDDARRFEGLAPPAPRDERWCEAAASERMFADGATGYDEALEIVVAFELHDHVARKLLDVGVHDVDLFGRRDVGEFVRSIARFGATVDWRTKLREKLGYELSARPIVDYFEPLRDWLERRNAGRVRTRLGP